MEESKGFCVIDFEVLALRAEKIQCCNFILKMNDKYVEKCYDYYKKYLR